MSVVIFSVLVFITPNDFLPYSFVYSQSASSLYKSLINYNKINILPINLCNKKGTIVIYTLYLK